jgi:hypothetical protein
MYETFEIDSQAELIKSKDKLAGVDTNKVLVFIDHNNKVIYLWRGKKADLFKKLMGTRVIAKLSHSYPNYRIRPIGEGSEPAAFLDLLGTRRVD